MSEDKKLFDQHDSNPDPITGEPGSHPVGTGIGAAGAGAIGTAIGGVIGGPVGAVIGGVIGSVAGGLAGKSAAEQINPTVEDEYWRNNYHSRPYVDKKNQYEEYQPAYKTGYEGYKQHGISGKTYDEVEPELRTSYEQQHGQAGLGWDNAKHAAKDAWHRAEQSISAGSHTEVDHSANPAMMQEQNLQNDESVRLYEERVIADKHRQKVGEVSVGKHIETEVAQASIPIEKERVVIEQVEPSGMGSAIASDSAHFGQGEIARVELYEEVPEIRKEAFVREEVTVKKVIDREVVNANEELRREELDIDTQGNPVIDQAASPSRRGEI